MSSTTQDPIVITRDELLHAVTASISDHRQLSNLAKLRIAARFDAQPPVAEAEAVTELLVAHVQTLRQAGPR